jgi:predicted nucleotidyltransferase
MSRQRVDDPVLAEMVNRLVAAFHPERIYLFGSRARGEAAHDSDYDLLVVVPNEAETARRKSRLAYQALRGTRVAADVIVRTRDEFDSRLGVIASLPATVAREGKLLYAA